MPISLMLPKSPRLESSILSAAHSALSTYLVQNELVRDLSRLGLIRYSVHWERIALTQEIFASVAAKSTKEESAGPRHVFAVQVSTSQNQIFADVEFEVFERKRGAKSSVLKEFSAPIRLEGEVNSQSWTIEDFCAQFPNFQVDLNSESWSIEALLLLLLGQENQSDRKSFRYNAYGVADLKKSVCVLQSAGSNDQQSPIEIVQGQSLIGQLI